MCHFWGSCPGKEEQFKILLENLNYLGELSKKKKIKVEVKVVPIKGINDSSETIKDFLDLCSDNKFRFKFLNFEPIIQNHIKYSLDFEKLLEKICKILSLDFDEVFINIEKTDREIVEII